MGLLIVGLVAWAAGAERTADLIWGAIALGGLVPLVITVARGLLRGETSVDVIALLAIAGSLLLEEYLAGAVIAVMLATGWALEEYAKGRSQRDLRALLERAPREAHRYEGDRIASITLEDVRAGDLLVVKPSEVVPVDGVVSDGVAVLDESALTGEAGPVGRSSGDLVRSGVTNAGSAFNMRATTTADESTYAGIVRLVSEAETSKAPFVRMADRYALVLLPVTLALAAVAWLISGDPVRALAVLVVATPCPLILAAPIAIVSGVSRAARRGIIIKGGAALESLSAGRVLLFDKTGTITAGRPVLSDIEAPGHVESSELLRLAASLDQMSMHVLGAAIAQAARNQGLQLDFPSDVTEEPGQGIRGRVDARTVAVGRAEWVSDGQPVPAWVGRLLRRTAIEGRGNVFVSVDGTLAGALVLDDPIRPDSARTLRVLRRAGIERIIMVTGDRGDVAETVAAAVGLDEVFAERTPAEKVQIVEAERAHGDTVMVGDGINDAPALAAADVGVALGARGATASSEAADAVLVVDRLDRLAEGIDIARRARAIALQSVLLGMGLSVAAMTAAVFGYLTPVAGAFLQEAIDVAAILNALRALSGYRRVTPPLKAHQAALTQRFQAEHSQLLPIVNQLRSIADQLRLIPPEEALSRLKALHVTLLEFVWPHEEAEEKDLYPMMAEILGGDDPTAAMSRSHVEIAHMIRVLGRLVEDISPEGPAPEDWPDVQRILYGLYAVLRLHFAQEEEAYLSLAEPNVGMEDASRPLLPTERTGQVDEIRGEAILPNRVRRPR
jgi:heavy metal translocating P-type ATPase